MPPMAQPELPGETWLPAQPTLRARPTDALPPAPQMGEKTTHCIQGPELSRARPPLPTLPRNTNPPCRSPASPGALQAPISPPCPAGMQPGSEQLPGPWLRTDRAAHLSCCAAPALRLLFATEELGGRENFSSRPRQELKTYALAANASPGARGDRGEPSTGFSTAAPAGAQPSCRSRRFKATRGLGTVTARSAPSSPVLWVADGAGGGAGWLLSQAGRPQSRPRRQTSSLRPS